MQIGFSSERLKIAYQATRCHRLEVHNLAAPLLHLVLNESIAHGTEWTVQGSNPGGGEIFRTCPDWPLNPPSLVYNENRDFPGGKAAGAWHLPHTPSTAEVK
jgi:hypothetical protein